jgi:hypothetical protein
VGLINALLAEGRLKVELSGLKRAGPLVERYRALEAQLTPPVRAPGVLEADAFDQVLYLRGEHKQPGDVVGRGFLDALGGEVFETQTSGRLELAEAMLARDNPLIWRVMANRLWVHVFGQGLVASADNLGRLGDPPSHPELLDWLALHLRDHGGSIKGLIRSLVSTRAFQRATLADSAAQRARVLLAGFPLRRLEAEAIRDGILAVSGRLQSERYGPAVDGAVPRRSVYVNVIRNRLDPFLNVFDAPVPSMTRGRRDETNVPAQSLALLNDPFVHEAASAWVQRVRSELGVDAAADATVVRRLYEQALNRQPRAQELEQVTGFLAAQRRELAAEQVVIEAKEKEKQALEERMAALQQLVRTGGGVDEDSALFGTPLAEWDFSKGAEDQVGDLDLRLHGAARIDSGALVLDGETAYASSAALNVSLRSKTLEAWVQLGDLAQRGGGVLTVQDLQGQVFDAIVFGEKTARQWHVGSNNSLRSEGLVAPLEEAALEQAVQVLVSYADDGTVTFYKNGMPHGQAFRKADLVGFAAGQAQFLLGCRHGAPSGNRLLRGRIFRAAVYDRALTAEEVALAYRLGKGLVGGLDLRLLTEAQQKEYEAVKEGLKQVQAFLAGQSIRDVDEAAFAALALGLFNLKEMVYLR